MTLHRRVQSQSVFVITLFSSAPYSVRWNNSQHEMQIIYAMFKAAECWISSSCESRGEHGTSSGLLHILIKRFRVMNI